MKNKTLETFLIENIEDIVNGSDKMITMKGIADELSFMFPKYKELFAPRRIGHYVRKIGYRTERTRTGYAIFKYMLHRRPVSQTLK